MVVSPRRICRGFLIDGERGFMVLYVCSPELNSVATEVRTGAMKAVEFCGDRPSGSAYFQAFGA